MPAMAAATAITMGMRMTTDANPMIYRLATWLSPAFPVGAYTYSSGLEYAVEAGMVGDGDALLDWIAGIVRVGSGRVDATLFRQAHDAAMAGDMERLAGIAEWGDAMRATSEAALESSAQGEAFLATLREAWPHDGLDDLAAMLSAMGRKPAYSIAVGAACGFHGVARQPALTAFLHAVAANLVSAGVRLIPLGQTEGQRITAALEPIVAEAAGATLERDITDIGAATAMVDWTSMRHETQYTRLFRS